MLYEEPYTNDVKRFVKPLWNIRMQMFLRLSSLTSDKMLVGFWPKLEQHESVWLPEGYSHYRFGHYLFCQAKFWAIAVRRSLRRHMRDVLALRRVQDMTGDERHVSCPAVSLDPEGVMPPDHRAGVRGS